MQQPLEDDQIQGVIDLFEDYYRVRHVGGMPSLSQFLIHRFNVKEGAEYDVIDWFIDMGLLYKTQQYHYNLTQIGGQCLSNEIGWARHRETVFKLKKRDDRNKRLSEARLVGEAYFYKYWWAPIVISLVTLLYTFYQNTNTNHSQEKVVQKMDSLSKALTANRQRLDSLSLRTNPVVVASPADSTK